MELSPTESFNLAESAYDAKGGSLEKFIKTVAPKLKSLIDLNTIKIINGISGAFSDTATGFGFFAVLKGSRSREVVLATRGTASMADVGTDLNAFSSEGQGGTLVHRGFNETFKSYVQQMNSFLDVRSLGFKPTAVHCIGHSLGGALANLNAAACSELGLNAYMYTLAAPRVGTIPYAEQLTKRLNSEHVYRVANESDVVPMVGCYPYVHAPFMHGSYLLEGGALKVNPMLHMMGNGYVSMLGKSWREMQAATKCKQMKLEHSMSLENLHLPEALAAYPAAMFSSSLLKRLNIMINVMLAKVGAVTLLSVNHFGTGAFTTLDQIAEILVREANYCTSKVKEQLAHIANGILNFLGRPSVALANIGVSLIRWVFNLLRSALHSMASQALQMVLRV